MTIHPCCQMITIASNQTLLLCLVSLPKQHTLFCFHPWAPHPRSLTGRHDAAEDSWGYLVMIVRCITIRSTQVVLGIVRSRSLAEVVVCSASVYAVMMPDDSMTAADTVEGTLEHRGHDSGAQSMDNTCDVGVVLRK